MKIKSQKDFVSGLMFVIVGVAFAIGATNYSLGESARPGPGYFPLGLSILLALIGAIVLIKSLVVETEDGDPIGKIAWRSLIVIVLAILSFAILLDRAGLVIALPVLVIITSCAGDEFKWKDVILNAIVLTITSWAMFVWGLNLTIPVWPAFMGG